MDKKTILYILSSNYSGSTLLSLMLGAHSRAIQIGEAKVLRRVDSSRPPCVICGVENICAVNEGITPENVDRLYDIQFERWPSVEVIVDNSKKPYWAERFLSQSAKYNLKFIHLVRDPRSLVRRWDIKFNTWSNVLVQRWRAIRHAKNIYLKDPFCSNTTLYAYKWLRQNQNISEFLARYKLEHRVVNYCDLVTNTEAELRQLNDYVGLEYEKQQETYWEVKQHGGGKTSDILARGGIHKDLRWQDYLTERTKLTISENGMINNYLAGLGLRFSEDGLVGLSESVRDKSVA